MADPGRGGSTFPGRRDFIAVGIGAFAVAVTPWLQRRRATVVRRTVPLMGTLADIAVVGHGTRHAEGAIDAAVAALVDVERVMTRFRPDSDIGRVNLCAARDAVSVGRATAHVVTAALRWAEATDGRFDPAIGRLVEVWDVTHRHEPPPLEMTRRFAGRRLFLAVEAELNGQRPVIRFHDADASLDLGGIAKGFGVDRAVAALRDWGIRNAIVNVGGDLYAMGSSGDGDPWRVGVRASSHPDGIVDVIEVRDGAVATSGDYEQGFTHEGRRYHHLLDPYTAAPRRVAAHSLSIAADDCMSADAAATALFGEDSGTIRRMLARLEPGATLIHAG